MGTTSGGLRSKAALLPYPYTLEARVAGLTIHASPLLIHRKRPSLSPAGIKLQS